MQAKTEKEKERERESTRELPHTHTTHHTHTDTHITHSRCREKERDVSSFDALVSSLNIAFLINSSILIVAAAVLWTHGLPLDDLQQAPALLSQLLGTRSAGYVRQIGTR